MLVFWVVKPCGLAGRYTNFSEEGTSNLIFVCSGFSRPTLLSFYGIRGQKLFMLK
jgi:hypothetical protein